MLKGIDRLLTCGGRAWYSLRILTRSLCHVEKHHHLNGLFNITPPYPHQQNQRRLTLSTPLHLKPNQQPPSSPRATRLQAHSAFLLSFFLNTPVSSRPAEDFTSHIPFNQSHIIGPLHVALIRPLNQISCPSPRTSPHVNKQLPPQIMAETFRHYVLDGTPCTLRGSLHIGTHPNVGLQFNAKSGRRERICNSV